MAPYYSSSDLLPYSSYSNPFVSIEELGGDSGTKLYSYRRSTTPALSALSSYYDSPVRSRYTGTDLDLPYYSSSYYYPSSLFSYRHRPSYMSRYYDYDYSPYYYSSPLTRTYRYNYSYYIPPVKYEPSPIIHRHYKRIYAPTSYTYIKEATPPPKVEPMILHHHHYPKTTTTVTSTRRSCSVPPTPTQYTQTYYHRYLI